MSQSHTLENSLGCIPAAIETTKVRYTGLLAELSPQNFIIFVENQIYSGDPGNGQSAEAEFFLHGKLVKRFGTVSSIRTSQKGVSFIGVDLKHPIEKNLIDEVMKNRAAA